MRGLDWTESKKLQARFKGTCYSPIEMPPLLPVSSLIRSSANTSKRPSTVPALRCVVLWGNNREEESGGISVPYMNGTTLAWLIRWVFFDGKPFLKTPAMKAKILGTVDNIFTSPWNNWLIPNNQYWALPRTSTFIPMKVLWESLFLQRVVHLAQHVHAFSQNVLEDFVWLVQIDPFYSHQEGKKPA